MRMGLMSRGLTALTLTLCAWHSYAIADLGKQYRLNVPAQPVTEALKAFAAQTKLQIVYYSDIAEGAASPGVVGALTAAEALKKMLGGTGLTFRFINDRTIAVSSSSDSSGANSPGRINSAAYGEHEESSKSFWNRFRLAQTDPASKADTQGTEGEDQTNTQSSNQKSEKRIELEEIIVTAQKRNERLQDVPVPVTAINAQALVDSNQLRLEDYYTKIPGLNLTTTGVYGGSVISIRGITSGVFNDGTVSVVIDDVPYGTTSAQGPGEVVPEIDPSELQRLEVLRGPQSTLYGASSLGGLVKYVTVDPTMDRVKGSLQSGVGGVRNGDDLGYSFRATINMPISNVLAVRASAFTRLEPGYIDDPVQNEESINSERVSGGRLSALWQISENFALKLGALLEDSELDGNAYVNLLPGQTQLMDLQQSTVPGSGGYEKKLQVYSANLTGDIGNANLMSISAYSISSNTYKFDQSPTLGGLANTFFGVRGVTAVQTLETEKFTQELRLTMPLGARIEWLAGAFFSDERTPQDDVISAADFNTGVRVGQMAFLDLPSTYTEYAVFSDVTFKFTDRFDVQVGGRGSYNKQSLKQTNTGPLFNGLQDIPKQFSSDRSFTYLLTPRFRVSPDLMVYARLASGYRPGGPNTNAALGVPPEFGPDRTQNYEIGIKGDAFDRMLSFDASIYHIDWKDVLVTLREPVIGASYKANAGEATSEGVDLSVKLRPLTGLTIATWGAWNVAELAEPFPANSTVRGLEGDRLPFSSRFSGNFSVDQEFSLTGSMTGIIGADLSYVGARRGVFTASGVREVFPSYTKIDARTGVRSASWEANFYVNNAADKRGVINGGAGNLYPNHYVFIQPRTVGVSLMKSF